MQLGIREVASLFEVADKTVYRWVEEDGLPAHEVEGQHRFHRAEVLEWATTRDLCPSPEIFGEAGDTTVCAIAAALERGGIFYDVPAAGRHAAIEGMVARLPELDTKDRALLAEILLSRRGFGSGGSRNAPSPARPAVAPRRSGPERASDTTEPSPARPAVAPRRSGPERASDTTEPSPARQAVGPRRSGPERASDTTIAIPHVRHPIIVDVANPMVCLFFFASPVDFEAGSVHTHPIHTAFTLLTPSVRTHLVMLSRLAFVVHEDEVRAALERRAPAHEILEVIRRTEAQWAESHGAGGSQGPLGQGTDHG